MPRRRPRRRGGRSPASERLLLNFNVTTTAGVQNNTSLFTAVTPNNLSRSHIKFNLINNTTTATDWGLVIVKQRQSIAAGSMSLSAANALYLPEEDVLGYAVGIAPPSISGAGVTSASSTTVIPISIRPLKLQFNDQVTVCLLTSNACSFMGVWNVRVSN